MKDFEFELVKYTDADYEFVFNVKKICYSRYVEYYFDRWDETEQRKLFDDFLEINKKYIKIIVCDGKKAGFVNGNNSDEGEYIQGNICLLPEFQGRGIGTKILSDVIRRHAEQDIRLRVFKINPAKDLYERLGFKVVAETNSHYIMIKKQKNRL